MNVTVDDALKLAVSRPGAGTGALPRAGWQSAGAAGCFVFVVSCYVMSVVGTTAANATVLFYSYPLMAAVGARIIFSEKMGRRGALALVLGMIGVGVILVFSWSPDHRVGVIYGTISGIAFAGFTLFQRGARLGDPVGLCSLYNLIAALVILPFAWGKLAVSGEALFVACILGTVQIAIPYVLYMKGLKAVPVAGAAVITLGEVVLNPLWVWLVIAEVPHPSTAVGGALIVVALLIRFAGRWRGKGI